MLKTKTGILQIKKLYLQMLFRCNFRCTHCFHGVDLERADRFTLPQARAVISLFAHEYKLQNVTLLGGEPFLHPDLYALLAYCKQLSLETVVCTNGYKIAKPLARASIHLDHLRVSLDGLRETHDKMRRPGSFDAAMQTLEEARNLGVSTSVTTTVTKQNINQIYELAKTVNRLGATSIKLHQLRLVGNAKKHNDMLCGADTLGALPHEISRIHQELPIEVLLDNDLDQRGCIMPGTTQIDAFELERIEIQPDGAMYVSCKAVGNGSNAFWFDKENMEIVYYPSRNDEVVMQTPQVRYSRPGRRSQ